MKWKILEYFKTYFSLNFRNANKLMVTVGFSFRKKRKAFCWLMNIRNSPLNHFSGLSLATVGLWWKLCTFVITSFDKQSEHFWQHSIIYLFLSMAVFLLTRSNWDVLLLFLHFDISLFKTLGNAKAFLLLAFLAFLSNGLVVKALDSKSRGPMFKATVWLQGQLSLSSFRGW